MHTQRHIVALAFLALPLVGWAGELPPAPEPPPIPKGYQPATPGDEAAPQVTRTTRSNGDVIDEYRIRGKLYMIRVTPRNGEPYYLIDQEGNQQFRRSDELREPLTPPQWVLKKW